VIETRLECPFCTDDIAIFRNELAQVRYDNHPMNPGHLLIIPKRHVADFFNVMWDEKVVLVALLDEAKRLLTNRYSPDGYNVGINVREAAGQTIMHAHINLIPCFRDTNLTDPLGGVRKPIPT
jgi:diadenosine tetraphosphate (Ap4A) HIT family hydrolase